MSTLHTSPSSILLGNLSQLPIHSRKIEFEHAASSSVWTILSIDKMEAESQETFQGDQLKPFCVAFICHIV